MNELQPHKDVMHAIPDILIIGSGWVGQAVLRRFPGATLVNEYGLVKGTLKEKYGFAFVCVPTPEREDESCDDSIVLNVIKKWETVAEIFIVRSTVAIESLVPVALNTVFIPEYLGETVEHPMTENKFVIIGGFRSLTSKVAELYTMTSHSSIRIRQTDMRTAILTKLMANTFYATKVSFCNQIFDVTKEYGIDYHELRELWLEDTRISRDHTFVYEGNRGFAGKCFPKDLNSLRSHGNYELLDSINNYNNKIRGYTK